MLKAVIFDMDGLLIDSEPFWKHIETQIFSEVGIRITPNDISQTTGLMISEVVEYWYQRFPWNTTIHSKEYIAHKIVEKVKVLIEEQ